MFDYQHYPNIEEMVISAPWSNIVVKVAEPGNNLIHLGHEKLRWPPEAQLIIVQKGKKLIVEVKNAKNDSQINFDIKAPKKMKLGINIGNSDETTIQDVEGDIAMNAGNIRKMQVQNAGAVVIDGGNVQTLVVNKADSVKLNLGNVTDAVIEDLQHDLDCETGNAKLTVKFNEKVTTTHHIKLEGGTFAFNLWAPRDTIIQNNVEASPVTLNITSDFVATTPNANNTTGNAGTIVVSGDVGVGSMSFRANP